MHAGWTIVELISDSTTSCQISQWLQLIPPTNLFVELPSAIILIVVCSRDVYAYDVIVM